VYTGRWWWLGFPPILAVTDIGLEIVYIKPFRCPYRKMYV
jgi:hypothetical protein